MATITKKDLIDRIAQAEDKPLKDSTTQIIAYKRVQVKNIIQRFLDQIVLELGTTNRLEFRDFGVFETKIRKARRAQNPKTLEPVHVPEKKTVKFKVGRVMKQKLAAISGGAIANGGADGRDTAKARDASDDD